MRLSEFAGTWRLTRVIRDARAGAEARFEGDALFAPAAEGLAYSETGLLHLPGHEPLAAGRRYVWREAAGRIFVDHADFRPFHDFDAAEPRPAATHFCAPDHYAVTYDFSGWPDWRAEWVVTGPRKDYVAESRYTRGDGMA